MNETGMSKTVSDLIMEYFSNNPNKELEHSPVVDWVTEQWLKEHENPPRDPWRAIRQLHQKGKLIKVRKGVYKYDPDLVQDVNLWDFPQHIKDEILKRDKYSCVVCGRGYRDGVELVVDHVKPKDRGGTNTIDNGQTLCMEHNNLKKNYSQTEAGKKYFIRMYKNAVANQDKKIISFCQSIFDVYDNFEIDRHIARPDGNKESS
jgi:5-methylcytosine-specific restriction endonuclease McrA